MLLLEGDKIGTSILFYKPRLWVGKTNENLGLIYRLLLFRLFKKSLIKRLGANSFTKINFTKIPFELKN